jgi:predicted Holliday junction resolvase-like endonuclease
MSELDAEHEDELDVVKQNQVDAISNLNEKWKDRVDNEVQRQLLKTIRQIRKDAIARSRFGQLGKTLEKMAPMFPGFGHHPYDVRPVFDPVDFVIFDGYFKGEVTDVTFVEFKTGQSRLNKVQDSIREAVERKRVHFETRRLRRETIDMLAEARPRRLAKLLD